jgi:hypothetical protein
MRQPNSRNTNHSESVRNVLVFFLSLPNGALLLLTLKEVRIKG